MLERAKDRSRGDSHLPAELMAGDRGGRQPVRGRRTARFEPRMRAAASVVHPPHPKKAAQVLRAAWDEETEARHGRPWEQAR